MPQMLKPNKANVERNKYLLPVYPLALCSAYLMHDVRVALLLWYPPDKIRAVKPPAVQKWTHGIS